MLKLKWQITKQSLELCPNVQTCKKWLWLIVDACAPVLHLSWVVFTSHINIPEFSIWAYRGRTRTVSKHFQRQGVLLRCQGRAQISSHCTKWTALFTEKTPDITGSMKNTLSACPVTVCVFLKHVNVNGLVLDFKSTFEKKNGISIVLKLGTKFSGTIVQEM